MLQALVADLSAASGVEVSVQLDSRLQELELAGCNVVSVSNSKEEVATFRRLAATADATIVIAPEFDDLLLRRCQIVEAVGGRLLGPASDIVEILADKLATARHLTNAGVPTPETQSLYEFVTSTGVSQFPAVVKPRFGAGSQDVQLVSGSDEITDRPNRADWVIQDFRCGHPVSVAALCGPGQIQLLPAVTQLLSDDGRFRYRGGRLPVSGEYEQRAQRLVRFALASLPRLAGFVGFDLVLGSDDCGREDVVIEINPRLTTSYIGLSYASQQNLAQAMIDVAAGKSAKLSFSRETIEFSPDGSICHV